MVFTYVGLLKQRFSFHAVKLCGRSKWIEAATSTHWIEGQPKEHLQITLPDVDVELFREYWEWVYSGTLSFSRCTSESKSNAKFAEFMLLVNLYKLGCSEKLEDVGLRNLATLELARSLEGCNIIPDQNLFAVVWSIKPYGDGLRNLLLDFMVAMGDRDAIGASGLLARYPSTFVRDLALAALNKAPVVDWQPAMINSPRYLEQEEPEVNT
jgi:hypothetical protein